MAGRQGEIWWGPAPHKSDPAYRPWLVVNNGFHPFSAVECIVVGMTTRDRPDGIAVPEEAWVRGGSQKDAHVSPWYVTTIKQRDLDTRQGELAKSLVTQAVEALHGYSRLVEP